MHLLYIFIVPVHTITLLKLMLIPLLLNYL